MSALPPIVDTLASIHAASPDIAFLIEAPSGRVLWVNAAFTDATGIAAAEIVGRDPSRLRPPEGPARSDWAGVASRIAAGECFRTDMVCRRPDGMEIIVAMTFLPVTPPGSGPSHVLGTGQEVTGARRLAAELRAREERFHDFAETASDWFWEQDADLRFTWLSNPVGRHSGTPAAAMIGRTRRETQPIVDEAALAAHEADQAARRPFRDFHFARRAADGSLRHFSISGRPVFDADGTFRGYRGTGRNITDLVEAERRLRAAIEAMHDGFALFDEDDRLVVHNERYLDIYHFHRLGTDILGKTFAELLEATPPDFFPWLAASDRADWIARRLERHRNPTGEPIEQQLSDGRWLLIYERRTAEGGVIGVWSDITSLKRAQLEARAAHEAAERHSRAKSEFLAHMSHELRTPLNAIIGFSETMNQELMGPIGAPRYREYAGDILQSGRYLLNLINDILDLSRVEAGRRELVPETFGLPALVDEAARMMRQPAEKAGVMLAVIPDPNIGQLTLDRRALQQMLLNLLSNAIKFSPEGGLVQVTFRRVLDGVVIAVSDEGPGIPADRIATLGRPFVQVDDVLSRRQPGSGLGLAITRALAELHGGQLAIESELGRGTRAALHLPIAIPLAAAA